jgi:hypothetical protein
MKIMIDINSPKDLIDLINGLIKEGKPLTYEQEQDIIVYLLTLRAKHVTTP